MILYRPIVLLIGCVSVHVITLAPTLLFSIRGVHLAVFSARTGTTVTIGPGAQQMSWREQQTRQLAVSVFSAATRHPSPYTAAQLHGGFSDDAGKRGFAGKQMALPRRIL
jgi:hypothetical protein